MWCCPVAAQHGHNNRDHKKEEKRTLPNLFVCAVTVLKGVVCSSGASIVKGDPRARRGMGRWVCEAGLRREGLGYGACGIGRAAISLVSMAVERAQAGDKQRG